MHAAHGDPLPYWQAMRSVHPARRAQRRRRCGPTV
jgi:hypothetical protein